MSTNQASLNKVGSVLAFHRTDMAVLCGTLCLLATIALKAINSGSIPTQASGCMNNLRQLMLAWKLYAADNRENVVGASAWSPASGEGIPNWSGGSWLGLRNPGDPGNWDHDKYTKASVLWPYARSTEFFTCPADPARARLPTGLQVPRIRSYSMICWVGGPGWGQSGPWIPNAESGWVVHLNMADFREMEPSGTIVLLEEREETINDGYFVVDMQGYPDAPSRFRIVDWPGAFHDRQGMLSFADGHVEPHRWMDGRTTPARSDLDPVSDVSSPSNPDVLWLQDHATRWR